jgi:dCMP deaminase
MDDTRDSLDVFYMKMAFLVSERAICLRRKVGSIIVKDKMVISTGYNGSPKGIPHCTHETCIREKNHIPSGQNQELCRGSHSEMNAIAQAAYQGISTKGATIYCTTKPCVYCAKAIINAGITRLVYSQDYGTNENELTDEVLQNIDVEIIKIK